MTNATCPDGETPADTDPDDDRNAEKQEKESDEKEQEKEREENEKENRENEREQFLRAEARHYGLDLAPAFFALHGDDAYTFRVQTLVARYVRFHTWKYLNA